MKTFPAAHSLSAAAVIACGLLSPLALHAQTAPHSGMKGAGMDQSMPHGKMDMKAMMKENNDKMASVPMSGNSGSAHETEKIVRYASPGIRSGRNLPWPTCLFCRQM